MATVPPPYSHASRDHPQVQQGPHTGTIASTSPTQDFSETTSVSIEWKITGLKSMYDATKGDQKSKCIKSAVFGDPDSLWEALFYANAGTSNQTAGDHVSLYLSCMPTPQERNSKLANQWTRKGLWWFKFEIRPASTSAHSKSEPIASKDASDHTFAVKTANWGWQAFAKRDLLFLHPAVVATDSFVITCTIQAQPQPPAGFWLGIGLQPGQTVGTNARGTGSGGGPSSWASEGECGGIAGGTGAGGGARRVVPKELVDSIGSMLDDPLYSDVEFIIPPRRHAPPRRIYASKKMLARCDYFQAMFNGGFKEDEDVFGEDDYGFNELGNLSDSDDEDEDESLVSDEEGRESPEMGLTTTTSRASSTPPHASHKHATSADIFIERESLDEKREDRNQGPASLNVLTEHQEDNTIDTGIGGLLEREQLDSAAGDIRKRKNEIIGPKKMRVVIRDAAWSTWWALLFWVYTDVIYFAPMSSSFENDPGLSTTSTIPITANDDPQSRQEWIQRWLEEHDVDVYPEGPYSPSHSGPDLNLGPRPVSAKSIYRLADKLGLLPLKLRAFQHICSQLTAQNVPAEVFSRFSSTFEDVRKVEVACFLKNWGEIKKSETMRTIWSDIRNGKHVGFEDVWPLIVGQLDFKPA